MKLSKIVAAAAALFAIAGSAHADIVNLSATSYQATDPSVYTGFQSLTLGAGTYNISVISDLHSGWTYKGGSGFREAFDLSTDGGMTFVSFDVNQPFSSYATTGAALQAFAQGPYDKFGGATDKKLIASDLSAMQFTLDAPGVVTFGLPDNYFADNTGGVSLSITAAVPEPETYALMLAGLGAMAFVARRRKI